MMIRFVLSMLILAAASPVMAGDWPQWRGPNLDGVAPDGTNPPLEWSETENIKWKTELPWWAGSTPVVSGDHIFLTSAVEPKEEKRIEARSVEDEGGIKMVFLCVDRKDGKVLWTRDMGEGNKLKRKHNMASPSPVTDGEHAWAMDGTGEIAAFDFSGKEIWRRNIQKDYGNFGQMWGYGASPLLYKDRLIIPVMHGWETEDDSYLLALDKLTGKTIWKQVRPTDAIKECPDAYTTPVLIEVDGKDQVVINGGDYVTANDPISGVELWRVGGLNPEGNEWYRIIASVVPAGDLLFAPSRRKPLLAIKPGGDGLLTADEAIAWETRWGPDVPTPVSDGKYLYVVDDDGRFYCIDTATGKALYKKRVEQGTYSASLVLAGDRIYALNESAITTVVATGPEFKVLATNHLDDGYTLSSPVPVGDQLFIRTSTHLYCIED